MQHSLELLQCVPLSKLHLIRLLDASIDSHLNNTVPHGGSQLIAKTQVTMIQVMTILNLTMKDEEQSKEACEEFEHIL